MPEPVAHHEQLPPKPKGKATVIGGTVGRLDKVRDRFSLQVYGGKPLPILYDARTELYRDGVRAPLGSLGPNERASVETTLDGTSVFALRIHILSQTLPGDCRGQVARVDTGGGWLEVRCNAGAEPTRFHAGLNVPVSFGGEQRPGTFANLTAQSLVEVEFNPGRQGAGEATRIRILAAPGQAFRFTGTVATLDLHAGRMVVADAHDGNSYAIRFDPARFSESTRLTEGAPVEVSAGFDGKEYTAESIRLP